MSNNNNNDIVELEELLNLLEEEEAPSKKPSKNARVDEEGKHVWKPNKDVERFIKKLNIQPGENKVPTYVIYYTFTTWANENWTRKWRPTEFFRTFKKHFEQKRTGRQRYYMLNDALDLSPEFEKKANKYYQKWVRSYSRGKK